jgi:hypothetical protein
LEIGEYRIVIREKLLFLTILSPPARILLAGSLVVGVSASVIMDEVNEAVVFPALGLSPP